MTFGHQDKSLDWAYIQLYTIHGFRAGRGNDVNQAVISVLSRKYVSKFGFK